MSPDTPAAKPRQLTRPTATTEVCITDMDGSPLIAIAITYNPQTGMTTNIDRAIERFRKAVQAQIDRVSLAEHEEAVVASEADIDALAKAIGVDPAKVKRTLAEMRRSIPKSRREMP